MENFFNKYPYTDFHELNLDWVIKKVHELSETVANWIITSEVKFADPIEWNPSNYYARYTIVLDSTTGDTYLSKKDVPAGIALDNYDYWYRIGNYNAQMVQYVRVFNTVNDMKNANLKSGEKVCTMGYYNTYDGGNAFYKITSSRSTTIISEELNNGLFAEIINENDYINVKQIGAVGDGITDDAPIFNKALEYYDSVFVPMQNGECYRIASDVNITKLGFSIFGDLIGKNRYAFSTLGCIFIDKDYAFKTYTGGSFNGLAFCGNKTLPYTQAPRTRNGMYLGVDSTGGTDIQIKDCYFTSFNVALNIQGRGVTIEDSQFTWVITPIAKYYSYDDPTTPGQTLTTGDRAFRVSNNRFHACDYMLKVYTGHLTGAIINDNISDVGGGILRLEGNASIVNSIILNNVVTQTDRIAIYIPTSGVFEDNVISSNTISSGAGKQPELFISVNASVSSFKGNIITENLFEGNKIDCIDIRVTPYNCVISNNVFRNVITTPNNQYHSVLRFKGAELCSIVGNSIEITGTTYNVQYLLAMRDSSDKINGCCIIGNTSNKNSIVPSNIGQGIKPNTIQSN